MAGKGGVQIRNSTFILKVEFLAKRNDNFSRTTMKYKKILLIGGPGTGKSSLINFLEQKGHCCFHEVSREVTLEAQKRGIEQLFLTEPLLFSKLLLEKRIAQFQSAEKKLGKMIFFDRGIPDVTAYLDYSKDAYPDFFIEANKQYRYDIVFILPLWKEIYSSDNERYESYEQAVKIQKQLRQTYTDLGYSMISVPKTTIEKRAVFILQQLYLS